MRNIIIHISGCQSSDTTTLSNKLKDRYNENIHLKDLDDLKNDFNQQKEISNYQEFINLFIEKHNDKPLILIGFTNNEIDTKYKYFIDNEKILKLCKKIHKKHNYKFLDIDKIMNKIFKIIENKKKYMKNYKIIKELGAGNHGTVYLVKNKKTKQKYAMKIQKIAKEDLEESLKSPIWREIDFAETLSSNYPQQFMKIYEYKNKKCNYVHYLSERGWYNLTYKNLEKYYRNLYDSPYCSIKITSIVDDTLHHIIYKIDDKKIVLDLFIQIVNIIYLINKEGYYHRDLHSSNIGVIFTKDKYITILNKQVLTHGYILSAIDYGMVLHKKYILDETEKNELKHNNDLYLSFNRIIMRIMLRNLVSKYYLRKYINKIVLISDKDAKTLEPILENIKDNNYNYFQEILYKIIFFDKFQEQLKIPDKVKLFEFIPIKSVKFIVRNFYNLKKILEHLIELQY